MKHAYLEERVLGIIDQVKNGQFAEGSDVELKAEWPDAIKAARRLAGHGNAARGDPILWIIGLDEKRGVVGAKKEDFAGWWAQVQKQFDREAPDLVMSISVSHDESSVMVLYFETSRAPFVVKNPAQGSEKAGIDFEVPWRDGTRVRSARREDLVRILVPVAKVPEFEVLESRAVIEQASTGRWHAKYEIGLYAVVRTPVVVAAHRCSLSVEPRHVLPRKPWHIQELAGPPKGNLGQDVHLERSSSFSLIVHGEIDGIGPILGSMFRCEVALGIIDIDARPVVQFELAHDPSRSNQRYLTYHLRR